MGFYNGYNGYGSGFPGAPYPTTYVPVPTAGSLQPGTPVGGSTDSFTPSSPPAKKKGLAGFLKGFVEGGVNMVKDLFSLPGLFMLAGTVGLTSLTGIAALPVFLGTVGFIYAGYQILKGAAENDTEAMGTGTFAALATVLGLKFLPEKVNVNGVEYRLPLKENAEYPGTRNQLGALFGRVKYQAVSSDTATPLSAWNVIGHRLGRKRSVGETGTSHFSRQKGVSFGRAGQTIGHTEVVQKALQGEMLTVAEMLKLPVQQTQQSARTKLFQKAGRSVSEIPKAETLYTQLKQQHEKLFEGADSPIVRASIAQLESNLVTIPYELRMNLDKASKSLSRDKDIKIQSAQQQIQNYLLERVKGMEGLNKAHFTQLHESRMNILKKANPARRDLDKLKHIEESLGRDLLRYDYKMMKDIKKARYQRSTGASNSHEVLFNNLSLKHPEWAYTLELEKVDPVLAKQWQFDIEKRFGMHVLSPLERSSWEPVIQDMDPLPLYEARKHRLEAQPNDSREYRKELAEIEEGIKLVAPSAKLKVANNWREYQELLSQDAPDASAIMLKKEQLTDLRAAGGVVTPRRSMIAQLENLKKLQNDVIFDLHQSPKQTFQTKRKIAYTLHKLEDMGLTLSDTNKAQLAEYSALPGNHRSDYLRSLGMRTPAQNAELLSLEKMNRYTQKTSAIEQAVFKIENRLEEPIQALDALPEAYNREVDLLKTYYEPSSSEVEQLQALQQLKASSTSKTWRLPEELEHRLVTLKGQSGLSANPKGFDIIRIEQLAKNKDDLSVGEQKELQTLGEKYGKEFEEYFIEKHKNPAYGELKESSLGDSYVLNEQEFKQLKVLYEMSDDNWSLNPQEKLRLKQLLLAKAQPGRLEALAKTVGEGLAFLTQKPVETVINERLASLKNTSAESISTEDKALLEQLTR